MKKRATPGRLPRQIHAPKYGRDKVPGNDFQPVRAGASSDFLSRRKTGQRPGGRRVKSMHRSIAAMKFRAMIFNLAAPERHPILYHNKVSGSVLDHGYTGCTPRQARGTRFGLCWTLKIKKGFRQCFSPDGSPSFFLLSYLLCIFNRKTTRTLNCTNVKLHEC